MPSNENIIERLLELATEELRRRPAPQPEDPERRDSTAGANNSSRPVIVVNEGQLRDRVGNALAALQRANDPPTLFARAGVLTRLRSQDYGPELAPLDVAGLLAELSEAANFYRKNRQDELEDADPPDKVIKAILGRRDYPFPGLRAIVRSPFFSQSGALIATPGYNSSADIFLSFDDGLAAQIPQIPDRPTEAQVTAAHTLIEELLCDFPFADTASKAHAIALMLLPFVREMIDGPTPIHAVNAPVEGTGKGKLITALCVPALGRIAAMSELTDQQEMRKRLTSIVLSGNPIAWFDNINREIRSGELAAMLTSDLWEDRILGQSKLVRMPVRTAWIIAGNNLCGSGEITRRAVEIRLDAKVPDPSNRTGFRHALPAWAYENRPRLIWAFLILVQNWIARDYLSFEKAFGSFEAWTRLMGGILNAAGIPGLLENRQEFRRTANQETENWNRFVSAWWEQHRENAVTAKSMVPLAEDLIPDEGDDRARAIRLGKALGKHVDRTFEIEPEGIKILVEILRAEAEREGGRKSPGYKLFKLSAPEDGECTIGASGEPSTDSQKTTKNTRFSVPGIGSCTAVATDHPRDAQAFENKLDSQSPDSPDSPATVPSGLPNELEPGEELL